MSTTLFLLLFFFNATATTEIYTLSLHDALPIYLQPHHAARGRDCLVCRVCAFPDQSVRPALQRDHGLQPAARRPGRSEEHTSELQSQSNLVCRLLLEKKKKQNNHNLKNTNIYEH